MVKNFLAPRPGMNLPRRQCVYLNRFCTIKGSRNSQMYSQKLWNSTMCDCGLELFKVVYGLEQTMKDILQESSQGKHRGGPNDIFDKKKKN